jgi:hypothetical protein
MRIGQSDADAEGCPTVLMNRGVYAFDDPGNPG